jgi:hypothetical protein
MNFKEFISNLTKENLDLINREFAKKEKSVPKFAFSKIRDADLEKLVYIEYNPNIKIFKNWLNNNITLDSDTITFLKKLIEDNRRYIKFYNEEDLKMKFLSPLFNRIDFRNFKYKFRDFYKQILEYKTDKFIFSGVTDFVISKGLKYGEKPYFFIQEFKKGIDTSDPEPQLLAELISGVEINGWSSMRGAYIIGENWNFVILEKLGVDKYQYFISRTFNSTNSDDLMGIYRNLLFVKNEIIEMLKDEEN